MLQALLPAGVAGAVGETSTPAAASKSFTMASPVSASLPFAGEIHGP